MNTQKIHDQLLIFKTAASKPKRLPESYREKFDQTAHSLGTSLESFRLQLTSIGDSGRFSPQGRKDEVKALTLMYQKEIRASHQRDADRIKSEISEAKAAALKREATPENEVIRFLRHREVLDWMKGQEPFKHKAIIQDAVNAGDLDFLDALASAPRYKPVVEPALLTAARKQIAEMRNPEVAKLQQVLDAYDYLHLTAETVVMAGAEAFDISDVTRTPAYLASEGRAS